jgi:hypothetical protein
VIAQKDKFFSAKPTIINVCGETACTTKAAKN